MATIFKFAFILVKFTDSSAEPISVDRARRLFTKVGRGGRFVVDWFDDNTHGSVDIGDSEVFGWLDLEESSVEYNQKRANGQPRERIVALGRAAATKANVNLAAFQNVVVVTNVEVDLFGYSGGVVAAAVFANKQRWEIQVAPSVLCQEMIHGLGASEHARSAGSDDDYRDPWDVMSMFNAYPGVHPVETDLPIGPGLNSAYMDRAGWLDMTRVSMSSTQVALRPLHRRDLPGYLAALVDGWYVEYRPKAGWDSGYSGSRVFVHRRDKNTSYLYAELTAGGTFHVGSKLRALGDSFTVTVDSIDDPSQTATVTIDSYHAREIVVGPAHVLFGVLNDGGGLIFVGGKIVRIPPRSPVTKVLEGVAALEELDARVIPLHLEHAVRTEILERMRSDLEAQLGELNELHTPEGRDRSDASFDPESGGEAGPQRG